MAGCGLTGLRRLSSGGQPSQGEPGLRRSTSCGAFFSAGSQPGDFGKRDLLLGVVSLPGAAALTSVCMTRANAGTGEPDPVAGITGPEQKPKPSADSVIILLDVMACMSTLYGHTCQHLREVWSMRYTEHTCDTISHVDESKLLWFNFLVLQVKAGYRSSITVPENISDSICDFSTGDGSPPLGKFLVAVDDVCSHAALASQRQAHQIGALQHAIKQQGTVLDSCYAKLLTGSTDTEVCQVMAKTLRACLASTDELVELVMSM